MKRYLARLIVTFAVMILAAPLATEAEQAGKVWRVGVLSPGSPPIGPLEAFRQGLRELGYAEGRNIAIEWRFANGRNERIPDLAREFVRLNVDVLFVINTQAAQAAKNATKTIPIVFARVSDPARSGLVESLARPGGNMTGVSNFADDLGPKRLQLVKEALPRVSRMAVLWNSENSGVALIVDAMKAASPAIGVQLESLGVRDSTDLQTVFEAARKSQVGALFVVDDLFINAHKREILDLALKSRLPISSLYPEFIKDGGLMAYGPSVPGMYRHAAVYVDRILKGAKPADLPVAQPDKFELTINLKTAKTLDLAIPQSLLLRADQVIQ